MTPTENVIGEPARQPTVSEALRSFAMFMRSGFDPASDIEMVATKFETAAGEFEQANTRIAALVEACKPFDCAAEIQGLDGDFPCRIEVTAWDIAKLSSAMQRIGNG